MENLVIFIFVIGYLAIVAEHKIGINKAASALATGVVCWSIYALSGEHAVSAELSHHFGAISEILFFLVGAMTLVEVIAAHDGFAVITDRITTRSLRALMWSVCLIAFLLSAVLDNLTTTIVMIMLLRKLILQDDQRRQFVGMVVIAANAGGAWSPIGDVTTTMLWAGGQVSALGIVKTLIIPSFLCLLVPLIIVSWNLKGTVVIRVDDNDGPTAKVPHGSRMLGIGVAGLLFVPIFKTVTHLPPVHGHDDCAGSSVDNR